MGLFEEDSLAGKLVDIGSLRLGMSSEATNPVVQVIDGDEQNVRLFRGGGVSLFESKYRNEEKCDRQFGCESIHLRCDIYRKKFHFASGIFCEDEVAHFGASSKCG